jgi:hypothetical protein
MLPLVHWIKLQSFLWKYKYFKYLNKILFLSRAITRAGFDSQLTLNSLGLLLRGKGLLAVKLHPIQRNLLFFLLNKKAHVFERACTPSQ